MGRKGENSYRRIIRKRGSNNPTAFDCTTDPTNHATAVSLPQFSSRFDERSGFFGAGRIRSASGNSSSMEFYGCWPLPSSLPVFVCPWVPDHSKIFLFQFIGSSMWSGSFSPITFYGFPKYPRTIRFTIIQRQLAGNIHHHCYGLAYLFHQVSSPGITVLWFANDWYQWGCVLKVWIHGVMSHNLNIHENLSRGPHPTNLTVLEQTVCSLIPTAFEVQPFIVHAGSMVAFVDLLLLFSYSACRIIRRATSLCTPTWSKVARSWFRQNASFHLWDWLEIPTLVW